MKDIIIDTQKNDVKIKAVGIGGAGSVVINHMITSGVQGIDFVIINTDRYILKQSEAPVKLIIGENLPKGYDGLNLYTIAKAAEEITDKIGSALKGADMVFITAGMGGITGTGAIPIVAETAKSQDIFTVGIVSKPFAFEGKKRMEYAEKGISELRKNVDLLIVIPCETLKSAWTEKLDIMNAFKKVDEAIEQGIQCVSSLVNTQGYINLDFTDVCKAMKTLGIPILE